jgi:hypothetical protein
MPARLIDLPPEFRSPPTRAPGPTSHHRQSAEANDTTPTRQTFPVTALVDVGDYRRLLASIFRAHDFLLPDLGEGVIRQLRDPDAADDELPD